ncbi:MAG: hypothetical protein K0U36_02860 [Alphaproteobacteria bacterium]|nr:hypothetical protein [Alphaproteobacteria bacterium]
MLFPSSLLRLCDTYKTESEVAETTLSMMITGNNKKLFANIRSGAHPRVDTYNRIVNWFDANWPTDLPWPEGIDRPSTAKTRCMACHAPATHIHDHLRFCDEHFYQALEMR